MLKSIALSPLALGILFAASLPARHLSADPKIVNGNFDKPRFPARTINSSAGYGWTKSFMGGVVIVSGNVKDGNGNKYGATPYGRQYLGLDPRTPQGFISRDSQSIPGFVAGETYTLTLEAADSDGGLAPQLDIMFSDGDGTTYFEQTYNLPVGGPYGDLIQFNTITANFTAPVSAVILLSLTNTGTGNDPGSISIDKVAIARASGQ